MLPYPYIIHATNGKVKVFLRNKMLEKKVFTIIENIRMLFGYYAEQRLQKMSNNTRCVAVTKTVI